MHLQPLPPDIRARNRKTVNLLVGVVTIFTIACLMYLIKYGANFERHGFH